MHIFSQIDESTRLIKRKHFFTESTIHLERFINGKWTETAWTFKTDWLYDNVDQYLDCLLYIEATNKPALLNSQNQES